MNTYKLIIKNIFSNWTNIFVSAVIGFFLMPFLVHRLGDTIYGIWILIISLTGYGVFLDFGIRSSIVKYVSQYQAVEDDQNLNGIFNTSLLIYVIVGIAVLVIAMVFSNYFSGLFKIAPIHATEAKWALLITFIGLALKFPFGVFEGFLCGIQRYDLMNGVSIGVSVLKGLVIVFFLRFGYKLIGLSLVILSFDLLYHFLMVYLCFRHLPHLRVNPRMVNKKLLKTIYVYGMYSFIILLASKVIYESDAIIIGIFLPANAITFYAIANNLVKYLRQISYGFGNVFNPAASELDARNEYDRIEQLFAYGTKYSLLFILPVAFSLIILGKEFISIWMGSGYARMSGGVLIILALSQIISMAQFSSGSILYGLNKHKHLAFLLIFEAVCKLTLSVALIGKHGIVGVALGTAIPEILVYLFLLPLYISKITKLSLAKYFKESFYPPFVNIIPFAGLLCIFKVYFPPVSWMGFMLEISGAVIVYGVTSLFLCFNGQQRSTIGGLLVSRFKRVNALG